MSELKKTDCISMENALKDLGIVKNTLNSYMNALGIPKHKFPFDRRVYITLSDFERIKRFIEENKR